MYTLFVKILNMSAMGGVLAAVVILLRLMLKKWPRKYICILWALVAIRLICPVSISSSLSAYNILSNDDQYTSGGAGYAQYYESGEGQGTDMDAAVPAQSSPAREMPEGRTDRADLTLTLLILLWAAGIAAMLFYGAICYRNLRKETSASLRIDRSIYIADNLRSPFILGVARPRIYLPSGLDEVTRNYVIEHEKAHLKRLDYIWKPLGYVILTLHWFNPLIWIAYILFCRDIEVSCDERVLADLDREGAIGYAGALLSLASGRRHILACPVAFGEYGVKARVKNILSYKKPAVWAGLAMIVVCLVCAVCFLTDPKRRSQDEDMKAVIETFYDLSNESITDLEVKDFSDVLDQESLFGKNYLTYLKEIVIQTEYALEKGYINSQQSSQPLAISVTKVVKDGSKATVKVTVSGDENEGYPMYACLGENHFILKYENERYLIESIQAEDIFIKMLNEKQFNEVDVQSIQDRVDKEYN